MPCQLSHKACFLRAFFRVRICAVNGKKAAEAALSGHIITALNRSPRFVLPCSGQSFQSSLLVRLILLPRGFTGFAHENREFENRCLSPRNAVLAMYFTFCHRGGSKSHCEGYPGGYFLRSRYAVIRDQRNKTMKDAPMPNDRLK